jgi:hypothetical protein
MVDPENPKKLWRGTSTAILATYYCQQKINCPHYAAAFSK